jgi:uncharacterized protein YjeT (DUF2065 family)
VTRTAFSLVLMLSGLLVLLYPAWAGAAELNFSGSLDNALTLSGSDIVFTDFNNVVNLKVEINSGAKESGVVLIQYPYSIPSAQTSQQNTVIINQAYLDLQLSANSWLRTGRQKISWGTGFVWNPTNCIGADKNRADLTILNPGVDAINYAIDWGKTSGNCLLKPSAQGQVDDWGRAVKVGFQILHSDFTVSGFQQGKRNTYGIDSATAIGDYTFYTEIAAKTGTMFYIDDLGDKLYRLEDQHYLHGVIGL